MENFEYGPFEYIRKNRQWEMYYNGAMISSVTIQGATRHEVIEAHENYRIELEVELRERNASEVLNLVEFETDDVLASLRVASWPNGLTPGIINDSSRFWLRTTNRLVSKEVTLGEFAKIAERHAAPKNYWISGVLPEAVMTRDLSDWRAPTSFEMRHIVGDGSFTGVNNETAAKLVGVTPQKLKKYTAKDGAVVRQKMSYAMWHLLLQKLEIQNVN